MQLFSICLSVFAKTAIANDQTAILAHVVRQHSQQLRRSLRGLEREGFRKVHILRSPEEVEAAEIVREPLWNNLKHEHGPFDIIGDVHGCFDELAELLIRLGYSAETGANGYAVSPPAGRKAIFLGDLVDRGPKISETLRLAMRMVKARHSPMRARQS